MSPEPGPLEALRALALALPGVAEGLSCAGTPVEKRAFQARGKTFLHLGLSKGHVVALLKLRDSLPEAHSVAASAPHRCKVGANGWVTLTLPPDEPPQAGVEEWLHESYRVLGEGR